MLLVVFLRLYMEDAFEVSEEPYFGYRRGTLFSYDAAGDDGAGAERVGIVNADPFRHLRHGGVAGGDFFCLLPDALRKGRGGEHDKSRAR